MLYVATMTRNLFSGSMLCRQGIKLVFESNKAVFTKSGSFVGKGYECGGMFRLSVVDTTANIFCSSYSNNNIDLWHSRLCHVNRDAIVRMSKMDLIPTYNFDRNHKCEVCVQAKQPRKPFHTVEGRNTSLLELVHSDICEMNGIRTKGGKKIFPYSNR
jgi:hypothetical protein